MLRTPHLLPAHGPLRAEDHLTIPRAFSDINERLLDTREVLPTSFIGARVEYPDVSLRIGDDIAVHIDSVIKHDVVATVEDVELTDELFRVLIKIDEPQFAVAALTVAVSPHAKQPRAMSYAQGILDISKHHAPVPGVLIKAAAKKAIGSYLARAVHNLG